MKTPLLSHICISYKEQNPELFYRGTELEQHLEKELTGFLSGEKTTEREIKFSNMLLEYGNEHYYGGMVDGFKLCLWLLEELGMSREKDFLQELFGKDACDISPFSP